MCCGYDTIHIVSTILFIQFPALMRTCSLSCIHGIWGLAKQIDIDSSRAPGPASVSWYIWMSTLWFVPQSHSIGSIFFSNTFQKYQTRKHLIHLSVQRDNRFQRTLHSNRRHPFSRHLVSPRNIVYSGDCNCYIWPRVIFMICPFFFRCGDWTIVRRMVRLPSGIISSNT